MILYAIFIFYSIINFENLSTNAQLKQGSQHTILLSAFGILQLSLEKKLKQHTSTSIGNDSNVHILKTQTIRYWITAFKTELQYIERIMSLALSLNSNKLVRFGKVFSHNSVHHFFFSLLCLCPPDFWQVPQSLHQMPKPSMQNVTTRSNSLKVIIYLLVLE